MTDPHEEKCLPLMIASIFQTPDGLEVLTRAYLWKFEHLDLDELTKKVLLNLEEAFKVLIDEEDRNLSLNEWCEKFTNTFSGNIFVFSCLSAPCSDVEEEMVNLYKLCDPLTSTFDFSDYPYVIGGPP